MPCWSRGGQKEFLVEGRLVRSLQPHGTADASAERRDVVKVIRLDWRFVLRAASPMQSA